MIEVQEFIVLKLLIIPISCSLAPDWLTEVSPTANSPIIQLRKVSDFSIYSLESPSVTPWGAVRRVRCHRKDSIQLSFVSWNAWSKWLKWTMSWHVTHHSNEPICGIIHFITHSPSSPSPGPSARGWGDEMKWINPCRMRRVHSLSLGAYGSVQVVM